MNNRPPRIKCHGILSILTSLIFVFSACQEQLTQPSGTGKLEFSILSSDLANGRAADAASPAAILVSAKDQQGNVVYEKEKLSLLQFGDSYLTKPLSFKSGNYSLTEFLVVDANNKVIYATPLQGSSIAYLVDQPLPLSFSIEKDQTTKLVPEVISTDAHIPADFGYSTFSFEIVKTFNFLVAVFAYNDTTKNFELTQSSFTVTTNNAVIFNRHLPDSTNNIIVRDSLSEYKIQVTKSGYASYTRIFTSDELKQYSGDKVLVITLLESGLRDGLVGEYLFDGSTDDTSGKNHHGVNMGASLTTDRRGNVNSAYSFNGQEGDYITIADNTDMNFSDDHDFSISLWTVIDSTQTPDGGINDILRKWNGDAQGYPFAIAYVNSYSATNQNKLIYVRADAAGCRNTPTSYAPVTNNVYHHVVFTKEGSTLRQYLDNNLVQEFGDYTSCGTTNNANITIGCRGQIVRFFTGKIDDIRIYNRAVSANEVDMLFKE